MQRGHNRDDSFFEEQDYTAYLDKLKEYAKKYDVAVHAYVLMTNHVHLLLTPETEKGVSQLMQALGRYYVRYVNTKYQRTGTLWEGRFKSILIDSEEYFLVVSRYIELNPVRADMVERPDDYSWSSYQANALGKRIELLTPHHCYRQLGRSKRKREEAYRALFDTRLSANTVTEITEATNKAWVLGSDRFKHQVEKQAGRRAVPLGRGGDRKSNAYRKQADQ